MYTILKALGQISLLCILSVFSDYLAAQCHISLPGSILGIFILFILLKTKLLRLEWVEQGANFLLAELLLFFIPSAVGIIKYQNLLVNDGLNIFLTIIPGTVIAMASAGLFASKISQVRRKKSI